jgi:hypothetical protein
VALCGRSPAELETVADDVEAAGGRATAMRADVRDEEAVWEFVEAAAAANGQIGVVVANAGVYHGTPGETPIDEEWYETFDDAIQTNVRGVHAVLREAVPHLAEDARVLVPSGDVAEEATPGYGAYAVSKAGAEAVIRQYAADRPETYGVVRPGVVATDLTGGAGRDPADVAEMFAWAATEADPDDLDGGVVTLGDWKRATR